MSLKGQNCKCYRFFILLTFTPFINKAKEKSNSASKAEIVKAFSPLQLLSFATEEQQSADTRVNEDLKKPQIRKTFNLHSKKWTKNHQDL